MPRLALAQGLTPQVAEQKEGFSVGVLFNSVNEKIYGKGPIYFTIIRADKPRFIQFRPREDGGGIIDMDVPANDPRTQWGPNGVKPVATKFYDYIVAMLPFSEDPMDNIIALSLKSTGIKVAKQLNTLMKFRQGPIFESVYELTTGVEKNTKGTYAVYKVRNAGYLTDAGMKEMCESLYESLRDRSIEIDRDVAGTDDVDDSMAANQEEGSSDM